jgi:hypothetical protein
MTIILFIHLSSILYRHLITSGEQNRTIAFIEGKITERNNEPKKNVRSGERELTGKNIKLRLL